MTETQSSICEWADATFGPPVSDASIAARALVEMAELVTACVAGELAERIGEEIADVVIVLARLGRGFGVDVIALYDNPPQRSRFGLASYHAANACSAIVEIIRHIDRGDDVRIANLGLALGALATIASGLCIDLPAAIDAKMAVNRARRWVTDGRGHGSHVKEAL